MGNGSVDGNLMMSDFEKGSVVDESPCKVNGKSLRMTDSGGSISE